MSVEAAIGRALAEITTDRQSKREKEFWIGAMKEERVHARRYCL